MAIRLFGDSPAFFLNDYEGPLHRPIKRITRKGVGGTIVIADEPVSIVHYGAKRIPVATPGRNITIEQERAFNQGKADLLPAELMKVLGVAPRFNPLAGRVGTTREFTFSSWRK